MLKEEFTDEKIILSVNTDPYIRCYRIHAYIINLIDQYYPDFILYVFSNYLNLHNRTFNHPRNHLDFNLDNNFLNIESLFRNNNFFDIVQLNIFERTMFKQCTMEIKDLIIGFLKRGYYILHVSNEACYLNYPDSQDNIVLTYGFDKSYFLLLGYSSNGVFGSTVVSVEQYFKSLETVTHCNRLNFIKVKKDLSFSFDFKKSINLINCYINSLNAYPDHEDYTCNIFGYESVERTIRDMKKHCFNIINIRVILEHKKILERYIQYLIKNNYLKNYSICIRYENIRKKMEVIFMRIIKKSLLGSSMDLNENLDSILILNEEEKDVLASLLESV